MAHSHHMHREQQVAHRRVAKILQGEPDGSMQHSGGGAFSKVTSKTAAEQHDSKMSGSKAPKRFARGGKVKGKHGGHQTNIAIVVPGGGKGATPGGPPMPPPGAMGPPPGGPPGGPGGPPMMPPPGAGGPPPGMPMRASGGKVIGGESSKANIKDWSARASKNSYARGGGLPDAGAATGVGRLEKAKR